MGPEDGHLVEWCLVSDVAVSADCDLIDPVHHSRVSAAHRLKDTVLKLTQGLSGRLTSSSSSQTAVMGKREDIFL